MDLNKKEEKEIVNEITDDEYCSQLENKIESFIENIGANNFKIIFYTFLSNDINKELIIYYFYLNSLKYKDNIIYMRNLKCVSESLKIAKYVKLYTKNYEIVEDEISVTVNHVMEKEHYIEFIALVTETKLYVERLYPEMDAQVRFKYIKGATLYAYCNKHGLWMSKVDK